MKKIVLLAYNGELTCFAHVMLYGIDLQAKGYQVSIIIEGAATSLITELAVEGKPFVNLYKQTREKDLIACICKACAQKMGTLEEATKQSLTIVGDMQGHPAIDGFIEDGYQILTF